MSCHMTFETLESLVLRFWHHTYIYVYVYVYIYIYTYIHMYMGGWVRAHVYVCVCARASVCVCACVHPPTQTQTHTHTQSHTPIHPPTQTHTCTHPSTYTHTRTPHLGRQIEVADNAHSQKRLQTEGGGKDSAIPSASEHATFGCLRSSRYGVLVQKGPGRNSEKFSARAY